MSGHPPQSPRWLLVKGREEEAIKSLTLLRKGRFTDAEITAELDALRVILQEQNENGVYADLWRGTNLRRTLITMGTNFFLHITGQIFASKYGDVYIQSLNSINPFTMVTVNQVCNLVAVVVSMAPVDRWGRQPLLFLGGATQIAGLFTMGGLGTPATVSPSMQLGIIVCIAIYGFWLLHRLGPRLAHPVGRDPLPATPRHDLPHRFGGKHHGAVRWPPPPISLGSTH